MGKQRNGHGLGVYRATDLVFILYHVAGLGVYKETDLVFILHHVATLFPLYSSDKDGRRICAVLQPRPSTRTSKVWNSPRK